MIKNILSNKEPYVLDKPKKIDNKPIEFEKIKNFIEKWDSSFRMACPEGFLKLCITP